MDEDNICAMRCGSIKITRERKREREREREREILRVRLHADSSTVQPLRRDADYTGLHPAFTLDMK